MSLVASTAEAGSSSLATRRVGFLRSGCGYLMIFFSIISHFITRYVTDGRNYQPRVAPEDYDERKRIVQLICRHALVRLKEQSPISIRVEIDGIRHPRLVTMAPESRHIMRRRELSIFPTLAPDKIVDDHIRRSSERLIDAFFRVRPSHEDEGHADDIAGGDITPERDDTERVTSEIHA